MFEEVGIKFQDTVIDRAHQIRNDYTGPKAKKKFKIAMTSVTTFRHRAIVNQSKKIKKGIKVHLYITKRAHQLLMKADKFTAGSDQVKFCFAGINY